MNKDISFIIPIYNTPSSILERCIRSIETQRKISFEIILVDDGSLPDYSRDYINIVRSYNDCYYLRQNNNGVSSARNLGLKAAKGRYVFFVDSDDVLVENALSSDDIKKQTADIIIYNVIQKKKKEQKIFELNLTPLSSKKEILPYFLQNGLMNWCFAKLFARSFLLANNLKFDTNKISGEDFCFTLNCFYLAKKVKYVSRIVYIYDYSDETGIKRILKNPLQNVKDIMALYFYRINIVDKNSELSYVTSELYTNVINDIFNNYSLLVRKERKKAILLNKYYVSEIKKISIPNKINYKTKVKVKLILHKSTLLIEIYYHLYLIKQYFKTRR